MNSLSLLLYLADVTDAIGHSLFIIGMLGSAIGVLGFFLCLDTDPDFDELRKYRHLVFYTAALVLLSTLFPSKETMYAIAASETGEEVLNSKVGTKATKALEAWLDKQIDNNTKEQGE